MLVKVRLIFLFILTHAEKIFHSRDHSDMTDVRRSELITDEDTAERFLSKYGFIRARDSDALQARTEFSDDISIFLDIQEAESGSGSGDLQHPEFTLALEEFQRVSGLPVTGAFDEATKAAMNKPRCGVPDLEEKPASTTPEPRASGAWKKRHSPALLKRRRKRNTNQWSGHMTFTKSLLRWRLIGEGYSSQLSLEEQKYIFRLAFRMWSEVSPLEFVEDKESSLENIDIKLGFGTGRHLGCSQRFDGAGREFAHAWFLGDIHFDDDEHFTIPNTGSGISLLKVAVHEIGHVLGLPHIYRSGSIMQPSYLPQEAGLELDWLDRKSIQSLYGVCKGGFSLVFDWIRQDQTGYGGERVLRFNTYFMRGSWYWLYENRRNRTRFGDPRALVAGWRGLPSAGVDAYVHIWNRKTDAAYFFKGLQYWRYDPENDRVFIRDPDRNLYPRLISDGFPGVSGPLDTAYYDRRDAHIYFFRGSQVFRFDIRLNRLSSSSPQKLMDVFPPVVVGNHPVRNLDSAYFSYTHSAVFLLKGDGFWQVSSSRGRWRRGLMPRRDVHQHWFDICDVHSSSLRTARR